MRRIYDTDNETEQHADLDDDEADDEEPS